MPKHRVVVIIGTVLLISLGLWMGQRTASRRPSESPAAAPSNIESEVPRRPAQEAIRSNAQSSPHSTPATLIPGASEAAQELHLPSLTAEDDLHTLDTLLMIYRQVLKQNPTGENYEITEALTGSNKNRVAVISREHPAISADGELLDRWGHPYFFHSVSSQKMEIRSAGPDGIFWSDDDIVLEE